MIAIYATLTTRGNPHATQHGANHTSCLAFVGSDERKAGCSVPIDFQDVLINRSKTTLLLENPFQRKPASHDGRILDMEKALYSFSQLPENWDSYGGSPISLIVIDEAKEILKSAIYLDLPEPWVAPGGDGSVGIQWEVDGADLYIDVVPREDTTYVLTPKEGSIGQSDGVLTTHNLSKVLNRFVKLTA